MAVFSSEFRHGEAVTFLDWQGNRRQGWFMAAEGEGGISVCTSIDNVGEEVVWFVDTGNIERRER